MRKYLLSLILFAGCYLGVGHSVLATTYYVSNSGNDTNPGTSVATAWQSIERVNQVMLKPGDRVLFNGAQTFEGTIGAQNSGTATQPIIYSSFGPGTATINSGNYWGFIAQNQDALEIRRLKFMGNGREVNATGGVFFYRDDEKITTQLQHIILDSLDVSGYKRYGIIIGSNSATADYWRNTYGYDDVRITNTATHDNGDTGIFSYGATLHAHRNWYIANCKSYNNSGATYIQDRNTGSGIVLANVDGALVEYCAAYNNGWLSSHANSGPAGIWAYACNNLIIQYSESYNNSSATLDGGGFDLDGGCTNSTLQYNYSHDNAGPGLMLAQYAGAPIALENLTIRYNVSENDARRYRGSITLWSSGAGGGIRNANIYNNTVFLSPTPGGYIPQAVDVGSGGIENVALRNNVFQTTAGLPFLNDVSGSVTFQGNCYWSSGAPAEWRHFSSTYTSMEQWRANTGAEMLDGAPTGLVADPKLTAPGQGGTGPWGPDKPISAWKAYQLQASSPLVGAGLDLKARFGISPGTHDLFGFPIPSGGARANIGAQGGSGGTPFRWSWLAFMPNTRTTGWGCTGQPQRSATALSLKFSAPQMVRPL
ncbi:right-handed parallel beta-helix repeat-containing protein [Hymenobacter sp. 5414T-23]|uniref:right-handed parallel beta-helix repeat-containing protein n=1 Tax=Hymenobacter sp. 5414T-23 TaxID=2932252 RepID=UPI001FD5128D|nr:right-handed parallel beta-helix repeat-containing protein [Hymenobacter sp. 5414T-23]UOQ82454.1 right-handed parallel beta-helix repeat-containing protein [Hymenobacter sp. 5414T-23]